MSSPDVDIYSSVLEFETLIRQLKNNTLTEVEDAHYRKIMSLSVRQMSALFILNRLMTNREEGVALKILAQHLKMSVPSTSHLVESMVKKGLFDRRENPLDRRSVCIKLSEEGENNFQYLHHATKRRVEELFSDIDAESQTNFCRLVVILAKKFYNQ